MSHRAARSCVALLLACSLGLVALASANTVYGPVTTVPTQSATSSEDTRVTSAYEVNCPGGSYVTGFTVTTDSSIALDANLMQNDILVASLWPLRCSNGDDVGESEKLETLPKSRSTYNRRADGYTGVTLFSGELVDAVSLQPAGAKYGGSGGGNVRRVSCPPGQVITGIYGRASATHMISLGLSCRYICGSNERCA